MSKLSSLKKEFDKGTPISTYVKKKYKFASVEEFEKYIVELEEKAKKYDDLIKDND